MDLKIKLLGALWGIVGVGTGVDVVAATVLVGGARGLSCEPGGPPGGGVFFLRSHGGSAFFAPVFGGPNRSDMSRATPPGLTIFAGTVAAGGKGTTTPGGGGGTKLMMG